MFWLTMSLDPLFSITASFRIPYLVLVWAGIILIASGVPFYLASIIPVMRAFKEKRLVTGGVYGMCRHPVYAAWLLFFVPATALLTDSWAFLSAPLVMYGIARALVPEEDAYLEETFGQEYLRYKQDVPAFMPYGHMKKGQQAR
ncbi:isoprenylcysteine carboxylmethyltransferase family protein [archaeon]|nr:isoprenylcysteine carboxylmethyltransferase family protein [archaeon]